MEEREISAGVVPNPAGWITNPAYGESVRPLVAEGTVEEDLSLNLIAMEMVTQSRIAPSAVW
jgi:hypothetical protein